MSQHQQAFEAENTNDVARVAQRVLSMLAAGDAQSAKGDPVYDQQPAAPGYDALFDQLYAASYCTDPSAFSQALREVHQAGHSGDVLAYELIPALARRLGVSWVEDAISFADVTIGCARLQSALRRLPDDVDNSPIAHGAPRQECLVMVPMGAQHTLGALVLAKQLRQARQRVVVSLEADETVLAELAEKHRFDVVLISASSGECPDSLRALIALTRQHWGACRVVVGGSFSETDLNDAPDLGADRVTSEWQEALDLCI